MIQTVIHFCNNVFVFILYCVFVYLMRKSDFWQRETKNETVQMRAMHKYSPTAFD